MAIFFQMFLYAEQVIRIHQTVHVMNTRCMLTMLSLVTSVSTINMLT